MPRRSNISCQTQALLATLATEPQAWRHGYELSKLTGLKSGTLYPLLIRLNDQGLLASRWQPVKQAGRPPRHVYQLTLSGLALARLQADQGPPASFFATTPVARPA
jgi:PadR family transcriptional regulator PadR